MEKYIFTNSSSKDESSYNDYNGFNKKAITGDYIIRKITFDLEKEFDRNDMYRIVYDGNEINYIEETLEFFNNKVSFKCNQKLHNWEYDGFEYIFNVYLYSEYEYLKKINYKTIEIDIYNTSIFIYQTKYTIYNTNYKNEFSMVITSNYFKTLDELIHYIMDISDLNYETSKQYLLKYDEKLIEFNLYQDDKNIDDIDLHNYVLYTNKN